MKIGLFFLALPLYRLRLMRRLKPSILFVLVALTGLSACSLNKTDESQKDRSMALLNQRKYDQSVGELEDKLRANPNDRSTALLLSMAHIGSANAEMLQLFSAVLGRQGKPAPSVLAKIQCDDEAWDSLKDKNLACVASRILRQTPEELNPDMGRAQQLLRQYYANPKLTEADVNFLSAYVELYRFLNRFRYLTGPRVGAEFRNLSLNAKKIEDVRTPEFEKADRLFALVVRELKSMGDEFMQVFRRLKYSYSKLAKYTASIDGKPILQYKRHVLVFDEDMSVARLARFVITVLNDEQGKADEKLDQHASNLGTTTVRVPSAAPKDKQGKVDEKLNQHFSGILSRAAPRLMQLARELKYATPSNLAWDKISTSFAFEKLLKDFLGSLGETAGRAPSADLTVWMTNEIDLASDAMWENPPGLFGEFVKAMRESWDTESLRALSAYHRASAPEWEELSAILQLWSKVRDNGEDRFEGNRMMTALVDRRERDREYLKFPSTVTAESMDQWIRDFVTEAGRYEQDYELGKFSSDLQPPSAERRELVHEAWSRTRAWLERNVLIQR